MIDPLHLHGENLRRPNTPATGAAREVRKSKGARSRRAARRQDCRATLLRKHAGGEKHRRPALKGSLINVQGIVLLRGPSTHPALGGLLVLG